MRIITALSLLAAAVAASCAESPVDVKLTPAIRQYCHIVRFRQGWRTRNYDPVIQQGLFYVYESPYEFRVPGVLETTLLVAGVVSPTTQYTINKYKIDLSDPPGIARLV
jgi:hypothetical protein